MKEEETKQRMKRNGRQIGGREGKIWKRNRRKRRLKKVRKKKKKKMEEN